MNEEQQKEWHAGSDWFASEKTKTKQKLKITLKEKKMNIKDEKMNASQVNAFTFSGSDLAREHVEVCECPFLTAEFSIGGNATVIRTRRGDLSSPTSEAYGSSTCARESN